MKQLYFGDNLDIMKKLYKEHPQGFIDLIYNDPPFNSKRNYNVLFEDIELKDTKAQKEAFADTWSNVSYHEMLNEIQTLDLDLYRFLMALDNTRVSKSAISYLTTMAIRIWYMHKLLKPTGSFYLHCDPTMSHYLKIVCDMIFGYQNFINEITWKRSSTHNDAKQGAKHFGRISDIILFFTKTNNYTFNHFYIPYEKSYIENTYNKVDEHGRRFKASDLSAAKPGGNTSYEWKGNKPPKGRFWAYSYENMLEFEKEGRLYYSSTGKPYYKHYLHEMSGKSVDNIWYDIVGIENKEERLGYPTQKPIALLDRIIKASSNPGDLVADFFCGCGTTVAAAEQNDRNWLGVDISHLAIKLIVSRLTKPYGIEKRKEILNEIKISGFPKDIASAKELAQNTDKHRVQFQDWVIEFLIGGVSNPKKSGDGGYDGYLTYYRNMEEKGFGIIEVKSGNVTVHTLKSFINVVDHQKADFGVFVCFEEQVTSGMKIYANKAGSVENYDNVNRIQIVTVEDLMNGKEVKIPGLSEITQFKIAKKRLDKEQKQEGLGFKG